MYIISVFVGLMNIAKELDMYLIHIIIMSHKLQIQAQKETDDPKWVLGLCTEFLRHVVTVISLGTFVNDTTNLTVKMAVSNHVDTVGNALLQRNRKHAIYSGNDPTHSKNITVNQ